MNYPHPEILDSLNPEQRVAAEATEGTVLVAAGAGSGKTRVLIARAAHLVKNLDVKPEQILTITFTRKAAGEVRHRLEDAIGREAAAKVALGTFHSLGVKILREWGSVVASGRFSVADDTEADERIRRALKVLGVPANTEGERPRELRERIAKTKSALVDHYASLFFSKILTTDDVIGAYRGIQPDLVGRIGEELGAPDGKRFAEQFNAYQTGLAQDNVMDYEDLICLPVLLFLIRPEIGRLVAIKWRYVMVDEYQDTDSAQDHLLHMLAMGHRNLFVVGDPLQAIYSWRGAKVENILTFAERVGECQVVGLSQNYRSRKRILDAANALLEARPELQTPNAPLWTTQGPGRRLRVWTSASQEAEAIAVADDIANALIDGDIESLDDVMVLYRLNSLSRVLETALQRAGVPYRVASGQALHQRPEVRDILSYLRVLANPDDLMSFERASGVPARGIGPATLEALGGFCRVSGVAPVHAARRAADIPGIRPKQAAALEEFAELLDQLTATEAHEGALAAIRQVIEHTGLRQALVEKLARAEYEEDDDLVHSLTDRIYDIDDFVLAAEEFARGWRDANGGAVVPASALLDALFTTAPSELAAEEVEGDEAFAGNGAVTLMTVHGAKGLEAKRVYVVGMEEGVFPAHDGSTEAMDSMSDELAEEARLCYVAITRAQDELILSASRTRELDRWDPRPMVRSRYLSAIPETLYRLEQFR